MAHTRSIRERFDAFPPTSYRADRAVPAFADERPLIVFDGVCVLCSHTMRRIASLDHHGHYRFTAAQGALGAALMRHYGLDPATPETVLLIDGGRAYGKLDIALRLARSVGGPFRLLTPLAVLPLRLQDWCYDLVAKDRYRIFGRYDVCRRPDPAWRERVIE